MCTRVHTTLNLDRTLDRVEQQVQVFQHAADEDNIFYTIPAAAAVAADRNPTRFPLLLVLLWH